MRLHRDDRSLGGGAQGLPRRRFRCGSGPAGAPSSGVAMTSPALRARSRSSAACLPALCPPPCRGKRGACYRPAAGAAGSSLGKSRRLRSSGLRERARRCFPGQPPVGQGDQIRPQRLRFAGLLREDVRQPVVRRSITVSPSRRAFSGVVWPTKRPPSTTMSPPLAGATWAAGAALAAGAGCAARRLPAQRPASTREAPKAPGPALGARPLRERR